jgi:hypothetical protein
MRRFFALVFLLTFLPSVACGASAAGKSDKFPARIDLPNGFFPEGIEKGRGTSYFVGSLATAAIWRGDLRTGAGAVLAPSLPGRVTVGVNYEPGRNRIWVAGGGQISLPTGDLKVGTGDVRVYDGSTGVLLATYQPPGVGLLNDINVTRDAVYVTDSARPQLVVIPLGRNRSLPPPSAATTLPVRGDFVQIPAFFNLNGIVAARGELLVGQTSTGKLFRVDPETGIADEVDLGGASLGSPDGLELRGRKLYVVSNFENRIIVVSLGPGLESGVVLGDITDPGLDFPSTVTVAAGRLWAANLRFTTPITPTTPYWITQLPLTPTRESEEEHGRKGADRDDSAARADERSEHGDD